MITADFHSFSRSIGHSMRSRSGMGIGSRRELNQWPGASSVPAAAPRPSKYTVHLFSDRNFWLKREEVRKLGREHEAAAKMVDFSRATLVSH